MPGTAERTLGELRAEFGRTRMLAMPIAGTVAWTAAAIFGALLQDDEARSYALFLCMPAVYPVAMLVSRILGEDTFNSQHANDLDSLFMLGILMSTLVWGIAIPFWLLEPSSLPLSGGILAGLMWIPLSWMLQHPVGIFHAVTRTILVVAAWFLFPDARFVAVPIAVVAVYLVSIVMLARRTLPDPARGRRAAARVSVR